MECLKTWVFSEETEIPADVQELLVQGEEPQFAFKTIRDVAIFTNKRLIVRDAQGLTGKKIEIYSLPYNIILSWSSENAGRLDLTTELELWTRIGLFKINLGRRVNVRKVDLLLAQAILT